MALASKVNAFLEEAKVGKKRAAPAPIKQEGAPQPPGQQLFLPVSLQLEHGNKEAREVSGWGLAALMHALAVSIGRAGRGRVGAPLPMRNVSPLVPSPLCSNCCGRWGKPSWPPPWRRVPLPPPSSTSRSSWSGRQREPLGVAGLGCSACRQHASVRTAASLAILSESGAGEGARRWAPLHPARRFILPPPSLPPRRRRLQRELDLVLGQHKDLVAAPAAPALVQLEASPCLRCVLPAGVRLPRPLLAGRPVRPALAS